MIFTGVIGATYQLGPTPIASGGEGEIYNVLGMDSQIAKIYKADALTPELEEKLTIMIEHPPSEAVMSQVAWPLDMLCDENGRCCGFVMPKLSINAELGEIYKYPAALPISVQQKINIAQNICVVISEVHKAGYVFGDFNPRNIGLDKDTGLVSFLDTDTYHVISPVGGKTYRCTVCAPGYAAPELLAKCSDFIAENPNASKSAYAQTPLPTFTQETDNFALAIHIFKLLMNGYTPFGGIIETSRVSQAAPGVGDAAVRRDSYCFKPGMKPQSVAIPAPDAFPKEITDLFSRAFIEGKHDPKKRPSAVEWHGALLEYEKSLVTCADNHLHQYDAKNSDCPFCAADERYVAVMGGKPLPNKLKQTTYGTPPPPVKITPVLSSAQKQTITPQPTPAQKPVNTPTPPPAITSTRVGDIVRFGVHDWRVLDIQGKYALILTENVILNRAYHTGHKDIAWEASDIRAYLNGTFFSSFSGADRARICQTTVINSTNQWFGTNGGNDTTDKIFLLSIEEVVRYFGDSGQLANQNHFKNKWWGFHDRYSNARIARNAEGTASWWWLRSPGGGSDHAAGVDAIGSLHMLGDRVSWAGGGVRPALWLNLES